MAYPYRRLTKPRLGTPIIKSHRSNLAGFWPFNEGSDDKVYDSSGNKNILTLANTSWVGGKFGPCLSFDGATSGGIGPDRNWSFGDFIVGARFKTDDTDVQALVGISDTDSANTEPVLILLYTHNGNVVIAFRYVEEGTWYLVTSDATYNDDEWHFAVGYRSGANLTVVVDGVSKTETEVSNAIPLASDPITVGYGWAGDAGWNWYWDGEIDVPFIYDRAPSASEIALLYREPFYMFKDSNEWPILGGYTTPVVGAAGIMTTNTGYWGPTF